MGIHAVWLRAIAHVGDCEPFVRVGETYHKSCGAGGFHPPYDGAGDAVRGIARELSGHHAGRSDRSRSRSMGVKRCS